MKLLFVFTVIFAAIMLMAAIRNKRNSYRLFGELERMKASVAKAENEKLKADLASLKKQLAPAPAPAASPAGY